MGVDRAVFYGVIAKIWTMFAGPISLLLIATRFSATVQGYYYSFTSLLMLQSIFELGLSTVIIQFTSHEWSLLDMDERGNVTGKPEAMSRLASLGKFSLLWFGIAGIVLIAVLGTGGHSSFRLLLMPVLNGNFRGLPFLLQQE